MQALLPPPYREVTLLEQIIQLVGSVHVFEQLSLHFLLCEPKESQYFWYEPEKPGGCLLHKVEHDGFWDHVDHRPSDNVVVRNNQEFWVYN